MLLLSGTASVVGHSSRHPGNLQAQLAETKRNLDSMLTVACQKLDRLSDFGKGSAFRVYVREEDQLYVVESFMRDNFPGAVFSVLQGDICRSELLCEIEGVHHF